MAQLCELEKTHTFWCLQHSNRKDPPAAQSCGPAPPVKPHLCDMVVQARTWPQSHKRNREENANQSWIQGMNALGKLWNTCKWWMQLWQIKVWLVLVALQQCLTVALPMPISGNRGPSGPILSRKFCHNNGGKMGQPTAPGESQLQRNQPLFGRHLFVSGP